MLGSLHYVGQPLVPLAQIASYLNFDIQGANLLSSLRQVSFALAGESGGPRMLQLIADAVHGEDLDTRRLTALFGQGRSDYIHFLNRGVPTVFFSDSTGPCYHTPGDNPEIVDLRKLEAQSRIGFKLALELAETDRLPRITRATGIVFGDAVSLKDIVDTVVASDIDLFSPSDQAKVRDFQTVLDATVAAGPTAFTPTVVFALLPRVLELIDILTNGLPCDAFLPETPAMLGN